MNLTLARGTHAHYQQGTGDHSYRDPRARGASASYRGALRSGRQRRSDLAGGKIDRRPGGEAAGAAARAGNLGAEHRGDHGFDASGKLSSVLIDSNVILDVVTDDPQWGEWSSRMLARCAEGGMLVINPIIYAEISIGFERIEELGGVLPADSFRGAPLPGEPAFLAGKSFLDYRRRGGSRRSPLPDFYIGAHAAVAGLPLL